MSKKITGKRHAANRHSTYRRTEHLPSEVRTTYVGHRKNTIRQHIKHIPYALHDRNDARKSMFRRIGKHIPHRRKGFLAVRKSPFRITARRLLRTRRDNMLILKRLYHLFITAVSGIKSLSVCKWRSLVKDGVMIFYHLGNALSPHRAAGKRRAVPTPSRHPRVRLTAHPVLRNAPPPSLPLSARYATM